MVIVSVQQPLAEHIHGMLFILGVVEQSLPQGHVTKRLRKSQQKRILTGFTTGQNIFHSIPLTLFLFFGGNTRNDQIDAAHGHVGHVLNSSLHVFLYFFGHGRDARTKSDHQIQG